jgi:hypothetical protein
MVVESEEERVDLVKAITLGLKHMTPDPTTTAFPATGFVHSPTRCSKIDTLPVTVADLVIFTQILSPRLNVLPAASNALVPAVSVREGAEAQLLPEYPEKQKHEPVLTSQVPNGPQFMEQDCFTTHA